MSTVEDLIRASLAERAGDITSVPADLLERDLLEPVRGSRRPWSVGAAAAAVVLAVVGIVVALRGHDTPSPRPAAPRQCASPSATAWRAALDRHVLRTPRILAGLSNGAFVETDGNELVLRPRTGTPTNLMVLPAHTQPMVDADGAEFVVRLPGDPHAYVYDAHGVGATIALLPDARAVVIQDGRLYYTTTFRGGEVVEYDLARNTTQAVYHGADPTLVHDAGLAVRWHRGHVAAKLPPAVRAALARVGRNKITYSGGSYEISTPAGTEIVAADGTATGPFADRGGKYGLGVAGHYLLRQATLTGPVRIYDTRTGAVLDTGSFSGVVTAGSRVALPDVRGTRILDTAKLPELRC